MAPPSHALPDANKDDRMRAEARQRVLELQRRREAARWVRALRAAEKDGMWGAELDAEIGAGAGGFSIATACASLGQAITKRVRDTEPCRDELTTVFDGPAHEVQAHNREVRRRSALVSQAPRMPVSLPRVPGEGTRYRERGASCSTRARGSRRRLTRSHSRGGDGGDDPGGDEPEPGEGRLDPSKTAEPVQ